MARFRNLLVISDDFPDQTNNYVGNIFVKEQLNYLKEYFDHIYVIIPTPYGIEKLRKVKQKDYKFDNVEVNYLRYFNLPFLYFFGRNYWLYLEKRAVLKFLKLKEVKYNLIHAHFTWRSGALAVSLADNKVPVVITEHTSITFKKAIEERDHIYRTAWKLCDSIIRVRRDDIHFFKEVGIPLEKVHYLPNGFDEGKFFKLDKQLCKKKLGLPDSKKIILNVGNLYDEVKGHHYLIEAINEVVKYNENILCIIIGDGKLKKKLQEQIDKSKLNKFIKLVGAKAHDEIPLWMNASDLFILPSLSEGNPVVMFEALGCGTPFIGTKVGGIPEVIISEDFGLLAEPANSEDLAEAISLALEKNWDYQKINEYARSFTWRQIANEINKIYEMLSDVMYAKV